MTKPKVLISIVIPFYNEEQNIKPLYLKLCQVFETSNFDFELIYVDDGSADQSLSLVEKLHQEDSRVKFISFSRNFGHQVALSAGLDYAQGDAVILMDSDLQHPPEVIPTLLSKWQKGYENVYTIRSNDYNQDSLKKYSSQLFYKVFYMLTKLKIPANGADFRLIDRKLVLQLRKMQERNRFLRGLIYWSGYKSIGIEYKEGLRKSGEKKYKLKNMILLAVDAITSFTTKPLYIGIFIGIIFAVLGFLYLLYVLYVSMVLGITVSGWASLISLFTILGGIQLIMMGMIGIYVGKIFEEVKQRPLYLVQKQKGFNE